MSRRERTVYDCSEVTSTSVHAELAFFHEAASQQYGTLFKVENCTPGLKLLCLKKVPTFKLPVALSNLTIFKILAHEICYET